MNLEEGSEPCSGQVGTKAHPVGLSGHQPLGYRMSWKVTEDTTLSLNPNLHSGGPGSSLYTPSKPHAEPVETVETHTTLPMGCSRRQCLDESVVHTDRPKASWTTPQALPYPSGGCKMGPSGTFIFTIWSV